MKWFLEVVIAFVDNWKWLETRWLNFIWLGTNLWIARRCVVEANVIHKVKSSQSRIAKATKVYQTKNDDLDEIETFIIEFQNMSDHELNHYGSTLVILWENYLELNLLLNIS
jgi:hypothetical protein